MMKVFPVVLFLLFSFQFGFSQELPPLTSFYPQTYEAGDQNWDVTQDQQKRIYFANNKGLLEYNGSRWQLYTTPNQSIMRSVLADKERIFSGQYRDFGYWSRTELGKLEYTSLMDEFDITPLEDEEFWGIEVLDEWLMFQSLDRIYILNENTGRVNILESETTLTEMVLVDNTIIFQKSDQGVFTIENGQASLLTNDPLISQDVLVDAFKKGATWYFVTQTRGVLEMVNDQVRKSVNGINQQIKTKSIYSALHLTNGDYALGSISNGLYLFNSNDELIYQLNQSNGLSNNTVLSVFEDVDQNLWLAMDNGISLINQNSRYEVFYDEEGRLGTVYASVIYNDQLYLGTNQGLFFKNNEGVFTLIEGMEGQVWSLNLINDRLFCGHDRGTFLITESNRPEKISDVQGTWSVKEVPHHSNLLLQGNYNGLYILEYKNGAWVLRNKLEGFDTSARYFEFLGTNEIVVSHEYKGVFYLSVNNGFDKIVKLTKDSIAQSVNSSLALYKNEVYYAFDKGIYRYIKGQSSFQKDTVVSQLASYSPYVSGKLLVTGGSDKLWYASRDGLSYLSPDNFTGDFIVDHLALPLGARASKSGYENLLDLSNNRYLLGTTEGYIIFDLGRKLERSPQVAIEHLGNATVGGPIKSIPIGKQNNFENAQNSFVFSYFSPIYNVLQSPNFRYRLLGYYDDWSDWSANSQVAFDNLPRGNYEFQVQSKFGDLTSDEIATYSFRVENPWYLSLKALGVYAILVVLLGFITHNVYKGYYKRQRNKLIKEKEKEMEFKEMEAQQQIMKFKNENLKLDIENKNRELGLSTMNLIQRNEVLSDIKKQLSQIKSLKDVKGVIGQINRQLNTTADWKVFEEAFNNADKDFIKNLKERHPELTANDLRLCSYLRLNLSSKEIAPLLNISHKSVEVKRYRLRKKMSLDHNVNLTDYILGV